MKPLSVVCIVIAVLSFSSVAMAVESGYIASADPDTFTGSSRIVTVRVWNTGDSDDMIIECDSKPSGWSVSPSYRNPYMTSGSYYDATFTVTPPSSDSSGTIVWKFYDDDVLSNDLLDTYNQSVTNTVPETITQPSTPTGPSSGLTGQSLTFTTGGSTSNKGHSVQYRFDWGDGSFSSWGSATQSKTYSNPGTYSIKAQARCATHTSVVSAWSGSKSVTVTRPKAGDILEADPDSFTGSARTVTVTVKNLGDDSANLIVEHTAPSGWSISPSSKQTSIPYNTTNSTYFTFTVTPPSSDSSATIQWRLYFDDTWPTPNTLLDTYNQSVINIVPKPDLIVTDIKMNGNTTLPSVYPSQDVRLDFYGKNIGDATSKTSIGMKWWWGTSQNAKTNEISTGLLGIINGLAPNEEEEETDASWIIPNLTPGTYWLTAEIDYDNKQNDEKREDNNLRSESFTVAPPPKPDLEVTAMQINDNTASDQHFTPGQNVHLDFQGHNAGDATSKTSIRMKWWYGTSANAKTYEIDYGYLGTINGLAPNEYEWETDASWTTPTTPGTYWLTAKIDDDNQQNDEKDEGNNERTLRFIVDPPPKPDLMVTSMEINDNTASGQHFTPGQSVRLDFQGYNGGHAVSKTNVQMKWYYGTSSYAKTNYIDVGYLGELNGLDPGEYEWETDASWDVPTTPGTYWLTTVIDSDNNNSEELENNNEATISFIVDVLPADLVVTSVDAVESGTYKPGDQIQVNYGIQNAGGQTSNSFTVDFYASTNTTITTSDYKIGSATYSDLQAGWTFSGADICQFPPNSFDSSPIPAGDYYIGIIVTCSNDSNPANNTGYDSDPGTVTVPDIRISPTTLNFEASTTTGGGTAVGNDQYSYHYSPFNSAEEGENAIESPYYYYYFDRKIPLILDVNQIAIEQHFEVGGVGATGQYEQYGVLDKDVNLSPITGWRLARTPASLLSREGVESLVGQMVRDKAADFVSPVFIGKQGGPIIITPTIFVGFENAVTDVEARNILSQYGAGSVIEPNYAGLEGVYRLSVMNRSGFEALQIANSLAELPEVRFAEPDRIFTSTSSLIPNDPDFPQCWGIHNTGQSGGTADIDMDGPEVWDLTTGDSSIIVVVIDVGVQQNHPDIHQIPGADFTGQGGGGDPVNACDNHGTAVAGCISATINNNLGTVGIAPDCVVASARVGISNTNPCDGRWTCTLSWTADALNWAEGIGARVTNNSNSYDTVSALIDTAYANTRSHGMVHFASAGNDATNTIAYPARLLTVNAVAAIDRQGNLATFSNHGVGLDFSAPGVAIYTTDRTGTDGYAGGDYVTDSGTSFASPYAAGVAALVLSVRPDLDAAGVEQILQQSAVDLGDAGYDTTFGCGLVNAFNAVTQATEAQSFTVYNDGSGTLSVTNITKQNNRSWLSFSPEPPFDIAAGSSQIVTVSVDPTGLSPDTYSDRLLVYSNDTDENPYPGGVYVNLRIPCTPPQITDQPDSQTVCVGQDVVFNVVATGTEPLQYQWKKNGANVGIDSSTLTLYGVQLSDDGSEIWCEVTNDCGSVTSSSAILRVYPWPTVTINPNPDRLNAGWTLDGPNGYTYSSNGDETIAGREFGSYTITWSNIPSWNTPLPNPDTKKLSIGNSINFIGNYLLIADYNNDYFVDIQDLAILVNYWLVSDSSIDLTGDDFINFSDFAVFAEHWLEGVQP